MRSKRMTPRRIVVGGFLTAILVGTILLMLPVSSASGVSINPVDCLFMSTSSVCVTGLSTIDPGTGLSLFGKIVLAVLMQTGGLGITVLGVIFIIAAGGRLGIGKQRIVKESLNLSTGKGLTDIIAGVAYMTMAFEFTGAVMCFFSFVKDYSTADAIGISVFHSIASFNNAGFDVLGEFRSLTDYNDDGWLCIVTCILIVAGGIGFFVFSELISGKPVKSWSLHTKIAVSVTMFLIISGTMTLKFTEGRGFSWMEAFFHSVSARTAGFASVDIGDFTNAGSLIIMILMFIGASPGSTGGGIKTVTAFVIFRRIVSVIFTKHCTAFKRKISDAAVVKAFTVCFMAISVILTGSFVIAAVESDFYLHQIMFEVISAFSTTGLSMGITTELCSLSKVVLVFVMFIGRLGPLTIATVWLNRDLPAVNYSEEDIMIG